MRRIGKKKLAPIRARLLHNKFLRHKYGALVPDFISAGREPGEIFYGNLTPAEFEALWLTSKRKGAPATAIRLLSEVTEPVDTPDNKKIGARVFVATYEKLYHDKDSTAVYVSTRELDTLGIEY